MSTKPVLPERPFTTAALADLGLTVRQLHQLMGSGEVSRVFRGVYASSHLADQQRTRALALSALLGPQAVVSDLTAAWLYGVPCQAPSDLDLAPPLQVVSLRGSDRRRRPELLAGSRDLHPEEISLVDGVPVTTPLRTACDIACLRGRSRALTALDGFARAFDLGPSDFAGILPRYRGRRGCLQLKSLLPHIDSRAESPGESWTRLAIIDAGLPVPRPQCWVELPGYGRARVDLALKHLKVAVEYDGEEFHGPDRAEHDRKRRNALRRAGWSVIVVTKHQLSGPSLDRWLAEYRGELAWRNPSPARRYAKGPRPS